MIKVAFQKHLEGHRFCTSPKNGTITSLLIFLWAWLLSLTHMATLHILCIHWINILHRGTPNAHQTYYSSLDIPYLGQAIALSHWWLLCFYSDPNPLTCQCWIDWAWAIEVFHRNCRDPAKKGGTAYKWLWTHSASLRKAEYSRTNSQRGRCTSLLRKNNSRILCHLKRLTSLSWHKLSQTTEIHESDEADCSPWKLKL